MSVLVTQTLDVICEQTWEAFMLCWTPVVKGALSAQDDFRKCTVRFARLDQSIRLQTYNMRSAKPENGPSFAASKNELNVNRSTTLHVYLKKYIPFSLFRLQLDGRVELLL